MSSTKNFKSGKSPKEPKAGKSSTAAGVKKSSKNSPRNSPRSSIDDTSSTDGSFNSKDKRRSRGLLSPLKFSSKTSPKAKQKPATKAKSSPSNSLNKSQLRYLSSAPDPGASNDASKSPVAKVLPTNTSADASTLSERKHTNETKTIEPSSTSSTKTLTSSPASSNDQITVSNETQLNSILATAALTDDDHKTSSTNSVEKKADRALSSSSDSSLPRSPGPHEDGKGGDAASRAMRQRKFSLSKSGRLKETKQRVTVSTTFDDI